MRQLIDKQELIKACEEERPRRAIKKAKPVDAVEVVRCKSCVYHKTIENCETEMVPKTVCGLGIGTYGTDFYCAYGRKNV